MMDRPHTLSRIWRSAVALAAALALLVSTTVAALPEAAFAAADTDSPFAICSADAGKSHGTNPDTPAKLPHSEGHACCLGAQVSGPLPQLAVLVSPLLLLVGSERLPASAIIAIEARDLAHSPRAPPVDPVLQFG